MSHADNIIKKTVIFSADADSISKSSVKVIRETTFTVNVNGKPLAGIACAGIHLKELSAGFLKSEKIIMTREDIEKIEINNKKSIANVILKNKKKLPKASVKNIASSGARGSANVETLLPVAANFKLKAKTVLKLMDQVLNKSVLHNKTGGTHCSALAAKGRIIALREDIGRHNTIDMLGGYALLNNINLSDTVMLTTGRISSEIVYKVWNMGIPIIISHSAPTAKAIELLRRANMTLIGYVRHDRMSIYSHERRVII
jgi:FdhD protein